MYRERVARGAGVSLEDIYTEAWFRQDFEGLQPEFDLVANGIHREFYEQRGAFEARVTDVGCGPGMLISTLDILGWDVCGIDGSPHALVMAPSGTEIQIDDITKLEDLGYRDLVICTEVAEHLDEKDAPNLVSLLCTGMCPIVFTAAPPGQDGHHHVNCRDPNYWINLFHEHGAIVDDACTDRLKLRWSKLKRLSHMTRNVMVFR